MALASPAFEARTEYWDNLKQVNWSRRTSPTCTHWCTRWQAVAAPLVLRALSSHARELEMMLLPLVESGFAPSANDKAAIERKLETAAGRRRTETHNHPGSLPLAS